MSVIIWCERFYPEIGGLEKAMFSLYKELKHNGIDVEILTCSRYYENKTEFEDIVYLAPDDFILASLEYLNRKAHKIKCIYISRIFQKSIERHINSLKHLPQDPTVILRAPTTYSLKHLNITQKAIINSIVDVIITLNSKSYNLCKKYFKGAEVLKHSNSTEIPIDFSLNPKNYYLFSGRITPSKNLLTLIKSWALINEKCKTRSPQLKIYGIPYHANYYKKCIQLAENTKNVSYCGAYEPGDIKIIDNASFVIIPSFREGHSNLLNEAYSSGTPVISTNIYGLSEHNYYDSRLIIKNSNDIEEISDVILYSWNMKCSNYISISQNVRNYAIDYFSHNEQADFLMSLIFAESNLEANFVYQ